MEIAPSKKVYRCEYCHQPVVDSDIQKGGCICGSRRIRVATSITADELETIKGRGYEFKPEYWMDEATAEQQRRLEPALPDSST